MVNLQTYQEIALAATIKLTRVNAKVRGVRLHNLKRGLKGPLELSSISQLLASI